MESLLLMQPNYAILGKRSWPLPPYNLALLKAILGEKLDVTIIDFNDSADNEQVMTAKLRELNPTYVGITSFSTEYNKEIHHHVKIVREALPEAKIILGGVYPTIQPHLAMEDPGVDYCLLGEGEERMATLINHLRTGEPLPHDGFAFRKDGKVEIHEPLGFIQDLDRFPLPDYGDLDVAAYGAKPIKFAQGLIARQYPYGVTITSRGCPFKCIFLRGPDHQRQQGAPAFRRERPG